MLKLINSIMLQVILYFFLILLLFFELSHHLYLFLPPLHIRIVVYEVLEYRFPTLQPII
jgi:hypothetical protein